MKLLRHKISVEQKTALIDELGDEQAFDWGEYCARRASVQPLRGREYFESAQEQTEVSHKITLRHDNTTKLINAEMRVNFGGRLFDIESVINISERDRWIELMCVERSTDVDHG